MTAGIPTYFFVAAEDPTPMGSLASCGFERADITHEWLDLIVRDSASAQASPAPAPVIMTEAMARLPATELVVHLMALFACSNDTSPAVDIDYLHEYTAGDRELQRDVLGLFTSTAMGYWRGMADTDDSAAWHEGAHSLKGTARGLGVAKLEKLAAEAESLKDSLDDWPRQRLQLRRAIIQAHLFILDNLATNA